MKKTVSIFCILTLCLPVVALGATCSRANLTRCLDSVCAINISSNPAARCQYCGTSGAGVPPKSSMKSVSVGQSSKNTISDKELKSAPSDPAERYIWGTEQCIKKITGCTADDVTESYDSLIEQSCTAAGISSQMATLQKKVGKEKTKNSCVAEVSACLIGDKKCSADYSSCKEESEFDSFFAVCSTEVTGCDSYISQIRTDLVAKRETTLKKASSITESIAVAYQNARQNKLKSIKSGCADNALRDKCVATVCANNMKNKCGVGFDNKKSFDNEKSMAIQLCKFYDVACEIAKKLK